MFFLGFFCFAGSYGYDLGTDEGEDRIDEALEEATEAAGVAGDEVLFHRARGLPIPKAKAVVVWATTKVEDERQDKQAQDRDDLETRKDKFRLPVSSYDEGVEGSYRNQYYGNPDANVDDAIPVPIPYNHRCRRYLCTQHHTCTQRIIPTHRKPHCRVRVSVRINRQPPANRQPRHNLPQALYHRKHNRPNNSIRQKYRQRPSPLQCHAGANK